MQPIVSLYRVEIDSPTPGRCTMKVTSQAAVRFYNKRVTAEQWTKTELKPRKRSRLAYTASWSRRVKPEIPVQ